MIANKLTTQNRLILTQIGLLLLLLQGCTTEPTRQFNYDHQQDGPCYGKYGGMYGYCDKD